MASPSAPVHPYRYLTLFLVLLIGAYLLVFLTGDKQPKPKLGIDLQGGTRVTLTARTPVHGLQVANELHRFIEDTVLPATGVASDAFWKGFDAIVSEFAPKNIALLAERDRLQAEMDKWHKAHPGPITDMPAYRGFLESIGYLLPQPKDVQTTTANVDAELALQAGPQLEIGRAHV